MKFTTRPVLVVGDLILDEYLHCSAEKLSAEAPVPIAVVDGSDYRLGGAANVAANIKSLGGEVRLFSVLGSEYASRQIHSLLESTGIDTIWMLPNGIVETPHKIRVIVNGQQIVRLDREKKYNAGPKNCDGCIQRILSAIAGCAAVIISDYAKGLIDRTICDTIVEAAAYEQIPVLLDPKISNKAAYPSHITAMTPNLREAEGLTGVHITDDKSLEEAGRTLLMRYGCSHVLITLGHDGVAIISKDGDTAGDVRMNKVAAEAREVFDVSGAGDTFIAAFTLARISGYTVGRAAMLANRAAGIVVGKKGTATVSLKELNAGTPDSD